MSKPTPAERRPSGSHSAIDLQIAVLRHLHTPIIVLSPHRKTVFANRAAERTLGSRDPIQSPGKGIIGLGPADVGIKLLYNRAWNEVLDQLVAAYKFAIVEGNEGPTHEVDAEVSSPILSYEERHFLILISILTADDGVHFILSFERPAHMEKKLIAQRTDQISMPDGAQFVTPNGVKDDTAADGSRDIQRIKRAVFDSSNVMAFILTVDEKLYLANKKAREILGDVMGGAEGCDGLSLRVRMKIWDEDFTRTLDPGEFPGVKLVRAKQPFTDYRCGFTHAVSGDKIVMNVNGECLYDDDTGKFMGGVCWCRDLQEYSEYLREEQERRLQSHETICNLLPHLVWTTTTGGMCDWFSQRWYEFTGLTREESMGEGFKQAIHPEDIPRLMEKWNSHTTQANECEVEIRYRRYDGLYKWMLVRAWPLRDENWTILKWYGTNTDIHDLVMARIEAARNKDQMLTVLAHAEVNMFSTDKDRIVTMAEGGMHWDNQGDIYNVNNKSSLLGKNAIDIAQSTQPGGIPNYEKNILDVLAGKVGTAISEDLIGDRVYRTCVVADLTHNSTDSGQKPEIQGVLGLSIDVTDMKARAALELDNTRLVLEEQAAKDSNRMKSQFLANMSHEMRTPTAGVIGMVELLGDDPTLTTEQREYVNSIHASAKALLTIVNDILDFSKIESGRLDIEEVPFNLPSIVGELCKLLGMFAHQKGLEFIYENNMDEDLELLGDPGRTRQVLSNLLTNALKFTKQGTVKLTVLSKLIEARGNGNETLEVKFIIEDTGIGIEKVVLDKLFRPFSQGDSSTARLYGGTGLGLTISRNLATLMHGSIALESNPTVGSKATFTVPLRVSSRRHDPRVDSTASSPNLGFRYAPPNKVPTGAPLLAHLSINQDLLNQQISSSVTHSYSPPIPSPSRHGSIDTSYNFPRTQLTPEQRSRIHVLVVEDNPINQTIAIKNIRKLGFPVTAVWNGREALSYLLSPSSSQPRPSIILMDVQMPVMDGYEATRILRTGIEYSHEQHEGEVITEGGASSHEPAKEKPKKENVAEGQDFAENEIGKRKRMQYLKDIPVIAMTASAIQGDREKCHEAGMDDYLAKPVEKAKLEEMLVRWAGRKRET